MYILRIVYLHYEVNIVDYMILLTITLDIAYFILYLRYKFIDISVCTVLYAILKSFVASCFWLYYADTWFERSTKKWKWFPSEHSYASPEKGTILNRKIHLQTSSQAFIFRGPSWIFRYTQPKKCEKFLFFPNLGLQKFLPFLHHEYPSEKKKNSNEHPRKTTSRRWSNSVHWMWSWNSWSFSANLGSPAATLRGASDEGRSNRWETNMGTITTYPHLCKDSEIIKTQPFQSLDKVLVPWRVVFVS